VGFANANPARGAPQLDFFFWQFGFRLRANKVEVIVHCSIFFLLFRFFLQTDCQGSKMQFFVFV